VLAKSEYNIESQFSEITEYYAASLPSKITYPAQPFTSVQKTSLQIEWVTPTIDSSIMIPINYYKVYWDEGFRNSGQFVLLDTVTSYD
jgi:Fibronectin type III domain